MRRLTDFREFQQFLASFTNYEKLPTFRYDAETLGLERMRRFAADVGDPQDRYPSIHIAGTKGKGTTTLILESLLRAEGFRVGAYTSPHVEHMRERIRVDGESITEAELVDIANELLPALESRVDTGEFPTFFELMTAMAMQYFARREVDYAIFEVGLGGRLDATNIVSARLTAITSIGLEHTEQLGESLAEIAAEKAGIIKPFVPVVVGELPDEAREIVERVARKKNAPVESPVAHKASSDVACVRGPGLRADLAIALRLFEDVLSSTGHTLDSARTREALERLELPARVEILDGEPPICVDGAHTVESIEALDDALDESDFPRPRTLVFSLVAGKRRDEILEILPRLADWVIFTRADATRSLPPEELIEAYGSGEAIEDPQEALAQAKRRGTAIVVSGSMYLAGCLRAPALEN